MSQKAQALLEASFPCLQSCQVVHKGLGDQRYYCQHRGIPQCTFDRNQWLYQLNFVMSLMKDGYPMNGTLKVKALEPLILHNIVADNPVVGRILRSWQAVVRKGKELGKKNVIAWEPYTFWVKERIQMAKLPFLFDPFIFPLVHEPELILLEDV